MSFYHEFIVYFTNLYLIIYIIFFRFYTLPSSAFQDVILSTPFLSSFSNGNSGCFGGWTFCGCLNPHFRCRVSKWRRCFASSSSICLGLKTGSVSTKIRWFCHRTCFLRCIVLLETLVVMVAVIGWSWRRRKVLFKSHTITPCSCLFMIQRVSKKSGFDLGHLSFDPDMSLKINVDSAAVVRFYFGSEFVLVQCGWVLNPSTLKWDSNRYARKDMASRYGLSKSICGRTLVMVVFSLRQVWDCGLASVLTDNFISQFWYGVTLSSMIRSGTHICHFLLQFGFAHCVVFAELYPWCLCLSLQFYILCLIFVV